MSDDTREGFGEPWGVFYGETAEGEHPFIQGSDARSEFGSIIAGRDERGDTPLTKDEVVRRMKRAVACTNACRGLHDPEAAIAGLVEAAKLYFRPAAIRGKHGPFCALIGSYGDCDCGLQSLQDAFAPFLAARKERDRG